MAGRKRRHVSVESNYSPEPEEAAPPVSPAGVPPTKRSLRRPPGPNNTSDSKATGTGSNTVPLSLFTTAFPTKSETLDLLDSLPDSRPEPAENVPDSLKHLTVGLHRDTDRDCLVVTGDGPGESVELLLKYLGARDRLHRSRAPLLDELDESSELSASRKALVMLYLSILAYQLDMEELRSLADRDLKGILDNAARLMPGWAWYDPDEQCWEGPMRCNHPDDLDAPGIISLVKALLANPPDAGKEGKEGQEMTMKDLLENGHGYHGVKPGGKSRTDMWLDDKSGRYERTCDSLVYEFLARRVQFLRLHAEFHGLLEEFPKVAVRLVVRSPMEPVPLFEYEEVKGKEEARCGDWRREYGLQTARGRHDELLPHLCGECRGKAEEIEDQDRCICGLELGNAENCEECKTYEPEEEEEGDEHGEEAEDSEDDSEVDQLLAMAELRVILDEAEDLFDSGDRDVYWWDVKRIAVGVLELVAEDELTAFVEELGREGGNCGSLATPERASVDSVGRLGPRQLRASTEVKREVKEGRMDCDV
ncbi:hypothetical protein BJ508DRAFT_414113 [Ascobolus immersus RN42]|uniref:Uncharacterized protein n=1 Tax=Ascobolus immersus RN42 TaxID=1160509 RepID=A0A3N4ILI6_ASCIM|nr:hypothetical protein BJ508DRAFT_414113 [Ascobolus immersus RN42]